ncbi:triose-phosphate isomerase [Marinigracilibium pacificum]|uniref:Triosephosphate isomerase n=1 Tax=Marinigracilibium pacificum TaxID=2729599 RepID=A0A848IV14_9BACT|nr:triose-phosphate isomerase [Marinigracilibium pacificum]NMM47071.1 triose-phosphate isomerase [Marinigracilibium pacificum]
MRKKIVAGNWKMNLLPEEGKILTSEIVNMAADEVPGDVTLVICPPYIHLDNVRKLIGDQDKVFMGAQNCHSEDSGAYTGEISAPMLKAMGAKYVILGHSERREYFSESDEFLAKKTDKVLSEGLTPIFCCGESLEQREGGDFVEFVTGQLTNSLFHLSAEEFSKIVIAYEPIWAIGTGLTASPEQAQEMHAAIRKHIAGKYGEEIANNISILYGGSCKPDNAKEIFACADVDGGLIGGASLKSRDFVDIAKSY